MKENRVSLTRQHKIVMTTVVLKISRLMLVFSFFFPIMDL